MHVSYELTLFLLKRLMTSIGMTGGWIRALGTSKTSGIGFSHFLYYLSCSDSYLMKNRTYYSFLCCHGCRRQMIAFGEHTVDFCPRNHFSNQYLYYFALNPKCRVLRTKARAAMFHVCLFSNGSRVIGFDLQSYVDLTADPGISCPRAWTKWFYHRSQLFQRKLHADSNLGLDCH